MSKATVTKRRFLRIELSEKDLVEMLEARHPEVKEFDAIFTKDFDDKIEHCYHRTGDYVGGLRHLIFHGEKDIE